MIHFLCFLMTGMVYMVKCAFSVLFLLQMIKIPPEITAPLQKPQETRHKVINLIWKVCVHIEYYYGMC